MGNQTQPQLVKQEHKDILAKIFEHYQMGDISTKGRWKRMRVSDNCWHCRMAVVFFMRSKGYTHRTIIQYFNLSKDMVRYSMQDGRIRLSETNNYPDAAKFRNEYKKLTNTAQ